MELFSFSCERTLAELDECQSLKLLASREFELVFSGHRKKWSAMYLDSYPTRRIEDFARLYMSKVFGGKYAKFNIDRFELAREFSPDEPLFNGEVRAIFQIVNKLTQSVAGRADLERVNLLALKDLMPHQSSSTPNFQVSWAIVLGYLFGGGNPQSEKPLWDYQPEKLIGRHLLKSPVPQNVAVALGEDRKKLTLRFLTLTEGLIASDDESLEGENQKIRELALFRDFNRAVAEGRYLDALGFFEIAVLPPHLYKWAGDEILANGTQEEIDCWIEVARLLTSETSFFVSQVLREARKNPGIFSKQAEQFVFDCMMDEDFGSRVYLWTLEYSLAARDSVLGSRLRQMFWSRRELWDEVTFDLVIRSHVHDEALDDLVAGLASLESASFMDFLNLRSLSEIQKAQKPEGLKRAIRDISSLVLQGSVEDVDFALYLRCLALESLDRIPHEALARAAAKQSAAYRQKLSKNSQYKKYLLEIPASMALHRPSYFESEFQELARSFEPFKNFIAIFPNADSFLELANSEHLEVTAKAFPLELSAFLDSLVPNEVRMENRVWQEASWKVLEAVERVSAPFEPETLPTLMFRIFTSDKWNFEEKKDVVGRVLAFRNVSVAKTIHKVLLSLGRKTNDSSLIRAIRDLTSASGIHLGAVAQSLVVNSNIRSGAYEARESITGPDLETWQSLAIVLDDVIHEMNQPLAAIGNSLVELRYALRKQGVALESLPSVEKLQSSLHLLAGRIDEYRALVLEGSKQSELDPYLLLREVATELQDFARERNVTMRLLDSELKSSMLVFGEGFKIKLAFRNLIRNAIQAAELGTQKSVGLNIFNPKGTKDEICIQVTDSGNGIPDDLREKIFEKGLTTKPGRGLGLGLSLTASVIRELKGNIYLEDSGPAGSTFIVRLPAVQRVDLSSEDASELEME